MHFLCFFYNILKCKDKKIQNMGIDIKKCGGFVFLKCIYMQYLFRVFKIILTKKYESEKEC
jgi:hypothetical protein